MTACDFFATRREYGEAAAVPIDLARNANEVAWDDVQVDAHIAADPPGMTTVGPTFHMGSHRGTVYLEQGYYQRARAAGRLAQWPPPADAQHAYQSLLRRGPGEATTRYHGFHAEVRALRGGLAHTAIFGVGSPKPHKIVWLDLADPGTCDPQALGLTTIVPAIGSRGAVFLSWATMAANDLQGPKLPPGDGAGPRVPSRRPR